MLYRGIGVSEIASRCTRTLFCVLTGVILDCSGSGEGIAGGHWSVGITFLKSGATTSAVDADTCSRDSCIIIGDDVY